MMTKSATPSDPVSPEEKERRQIYCYLVLSLLYHYWNPLKKGSKGTYHWLAKQPEDVRQ